MADCLFCRIVAGEIPATIVYQDDHLVAFKDINPQAPMHVLVVPRRHIATPQRPDRRRRCAGRRDGAAGRGAREASAGYAERGYRTVFNCNADAGQTVFHIHLHVLGGRTLTWPPG